MFKQRARMSETPVSSEEKDPTCVVKMLESLTRRNQRVGVGLHLGFGVGLSGNSHRSSALGVGLGRRRGAAVATRLRFDETMNIERPKEFSNRKRFFDTEGEIKHLSLLHSSVEKKLKLENAEPSNAPVPASPWEIRLMKADLLSARSQIEVLENRNQQLHALRREQELVFEHEKASFQLQHDADVNRIKDLESRTEILKKRRDTFKEELDEIKANFNSLNNDSGGSMRVLEKRVAELANQLRECELTLQRNTAAGSQREAQLEMKLSSALDVAALHEQRVVELTTKLQEIRREQHEGETTRQQLEETQLKLKSLESEKADMEEAVALASSHKQKVLKFHELEQEISKLKDDNARLRELVKNKLILEEKVTNLETRLASTEEIDKECAHLQAKLSFLEGSHNEWLTLAKDLGSSSKTPASLRLRFEHLQQRELQLTADFAELKSRLKATVEIKNSTVAELDSLRAQFEKQKLVNEQQTNFLQRQRKKLALISQERDYYRSQLDAYEKELTISTTTVAPTSQQEQLRVRIALLEKTVQGYHEVVERLESDNAKEKKMGGPTESTDKDRAIGLEEEMSKLKQENVELKRKKEELQLELQYCSQYVNPATNTKVLHLRNNPRSEAESKREDELFVLRAECKKLQERVRVLSDGRSKDVTLTVEENVRSTNTREVESLQDQVNNYKVKVLRLKEAFKKTSNEFREVVYQVLGYRIDWKNANEYHLSSMYAESPEDILVFQYDAESGDVNMLETSFSKTLKTLMDLHLRVQKSIPVFLSAVTLDLFSQQTMATITEPITLIE